jgi:hypothetical protein
VYAAETYVSAEVLEHALKTIGGKVEDKDAFMKALREAKVPNTCAGPVRFDELGNVVGNIYIRKVEKKDGKYVNAVIKTYPDVSQFWTYKQDEVPQEPGLFARLPAGTKSRAIEHDPETWIPFLKGSCFGHKDTDRPRREAQAARGDGGAVARDRARRSHRVGGSDRSCQQGQIQPHDENQRVASPCGSEPFVRGRAARGTNVEPGHQLGTGGTRMLRATADIKLPTAIVGSLPRPSWYTENLGSRSFLAAMVNARYREQYVDALGVLPARAAACRSRYPDRR